MMAENQHAELVAQLTEGISALTSSEQWKRYLVFQSRFHHYSYGNALLIAAQCHQASRVAGFTAWKKLNRFVRKGEKAIWVIAPMIYKSAKDTENDQIIRGFKFVPVFDIAQTDGEELPSVCTQLDGDDPEGLFAQLVTVAQSIGFRVEDHEFDGSTNGDCRHADHRIRVEKTAKPTQRVKTLVHELAHALLHESYANRALAELEAESTAFVVCQVLGIDSGSYSFGYVATWAGDGSQAIAGIKASCQRIQKSAAANLQALEPEADDEAA